MATKDVSPRNIGYSAVIMSKDFKEQMMVKGIRFLIQLDNGYEEVYRDDEMVKVLDPQPEPEVPAEVEVGEGA